MVKNALLTLVSLAFVAAGVFLLQQADPSARFMAYGAIAFFGACAIAGAIQLIPRQRAVLDSDGGLTVLPDPVQTTGLMIGAFGMAVGCYFIAPEAASSGRQVVSAAAYFGIVFFGACGLVALWRLFNVKPLGQLDSNGVRWFGPGGWELAWREISGLSVIDVSGTKLLRFNTGAPSNTPMRIGDRMLTVSGTRLAFEDVCAIAADLWERHRAG